MYKRPVLFRTCAGQQMIDCVRACFLFLVPQRGLWTKISVNLCSIDSALTPALYSMAAEDSNNNARTGAKSDGAFGRDPYVSRQEAQRESVQ